MLNLIIAGTRAQAQVYATSMGWGRNEWKYLYHPLQLLGMRGVTIHRVGEHWNSPLATSEELRDLISFRFADFVDGEL